MKKFFSLAFISLLATFIFFSNTFSEEIKTFKDEAAKYRLEGLDAQEKGDFDKAMQFFQKAISIDPTYAIAHNDLGIIYEEKKMLERAESEYLEAIKIDPNYLPSYSNLALLYEVRGEIEKAIEYWRKRASLGLENDPWTEKAKENLKRLNAALDEPVIIDKDSGIALQKQLFEEAEYLSRTIALDKEIAREQSESQFLEYKEKGLSLYNEGKFDLALEEFKKARAIFALNNEINLLIEDSEAKYAQGLIENYSKNGLALFKDKNFDNSREEFRKVMNILTTIIEEQKKQAVYAKPAQ